MRYDELTAPAGPSQAPLPAPVPPWLGPQPYEAASPDLPPPLVLRRPEHIISRTHIPEMVLKVLYRLYRSGYTAYLVGGGVRDLLLGRTPKDFDVGTSAHPKEVKKLFRNCRLIGRRFRLAHILFGAGRIVEVATFRRIPTPEEEAAAAALLLPEAAVDEALAEAGAEDQWEVVAEQSEGPAQADFIATPSGLVPALLDGADAPPPADTSPANPAPGTEADIYGSPAEDAWRRDFTVNGLFYDIATFSVVDYVGGLQDLERRQIRTIGDPAVRFQEDGVRLLRAIRLGSRLEFTIEPATWDALVAQKEAITTCSPSRVTEEIWKLLECGAAAPCVALLDSSGLLGILLPPIQEAVHRWRAASRVQHKAGGGEDHGGTDAAEADLPENRFWAMLAAIDHMTAASGPPRRSVLLAALLWPLLEQAAKEAPEGTPYNEVVRGLSDSLIASMNITRGDREEAALCLSSQRKLSLTGRRHLPKGILSKPYFEGALSLLELRTMSGDADPRELVWWQRHVHAHSAAGAAGGPPAPGMEAVPLPADLSGSNAPSQERPKRRRRKRGPRRRSGPGAAATAPSAT